jgi:signal transduction histidine kinase
VTQDDRNRSTTLSPDDRLLVVAPTGRDSDLLAKVLGEEGIAVCVCTSVMDACSEVLLGASAMLLAEEALIGSDMAAINTLLDLQPEWSDLPVLILVTGGKETMVSRERARERTDLHLNNVTLLERPIRIGTLVSSVQMAMRSRIRQYEIRGNLAQRVVAEEAVRRSEKLAVAGRLAASIAHEINNPLEAVTNLLYLITTSDNLEEVRAFARTAEQELARVSEITTQTLRFHRQQSKAIDLSLVELLESVLGLFHARLTGLDIEVVRDFRTAQTVHVFAGEIRQVIANLVAASCTCG